MIIKNEAGKGSEERFKEFSVIVLARFNIRSLVYSAYSMNILS